MDDKQAPARLLGKTHSGLGTLSRDYVVAYALPR